MLLRPFGLQRVSTGVSGPHLPADRLEIVFILAFGRYCVVPISVQKL